MELHQLRYFAAVAELGSFTRAAEKCLVAQPSLSLQIRKLETELGGPLFERLGRSIRLTAAGRALQSHAAQVLSVVDGLRERITAAADPARGTLSVGAIPTIAPYFLPAVLKGFSRRFPQATVALHENLTDHIVRACAAGEIDLGVIATLPEDDRLEQFELFTEELLLALPPRHAAAARDCVTLSELAGEPFVLLDEIHCLGEQTLGFCKQQGFLPTVRCRGVQLLTLQELVALGHGVSLLPAMACGADRGKRCTYRHLADPRPTRTLRVVRRRDRTGNPLATAFLAALQAAVPSRE